MAICCVITVPVDELSEIWQCVIDLEGTKYIMAIRGERKKDLSMPALDGLEGL